MKAIILQSFKQIKFTFIGICIHQRSPAVCFSKLDIENHTEHRVGHELRFINEPEKNTELKRTRTNFCGVSPSGVRTSSLSIFIVRNREKWHPSVYSVVDRLSHYFIFNNKFKCFIEE